MWRQYGFSLTELLFTIAILAILVAISIPSYQSYIREARLYDAKQALLKNVNAVERHYGQHYRFTKNSTTWADLPIPETATELFNRKTKLFCIKFQGNPRGVRGDRFTMKAVAFDKTNEPRAIVIDDDQQMRVCENTSSTCEEKNYFAGASTRTDTGCRFL